MKTAIAAATIGIFTLVSAPIATENYTPWQPAPLKSMLFQKERHASHARP